MLLEREITLAGAFRGTSKDSGLFSFQQHFKRGGVNARAGGNAYGGWVCAQVFKRAAAQHSAIIGQGFSPLARRVVPIMTHYVGAA